MGHSNTIDQQAKQNAAFQTYIDEQTAALSKTVADASATINARIADYYTKGGWDDAKPLISGTYQHVSTTSEWSLDAVADMIKQIQSTIFGGPPPKGSDAPPQSQDLKEAVAKMTDMEVLITDAAFTAIEGILEAFASGTQTTVQTKVETQELAPGLTLFLAVIENQYHRSDFVSDNTIIQNAYVFDTRFSIKQGGDIAKFNQMTSLIAQQDAQEKIAAKCDQAIGDLDVTSADFAAQEAKFQGISDRANTQVGALQAEIEKLEQKAALAASGSRR
jgi:hypothetical protein